MLDVSIRYVTWCVRDMKGSTSVPRMCLG